MQYVYRYAVVAGRDVWKWQQEGTLVWTTANTEREAIAQIEQDAAKRGLSAWISDISLFRPRTDQSPENPEISPRVREPIDQGGVNTARTAATGAFDTSARTLQADTESGTYQGTITGETKQYILQRQSARTIVLHPKHLLDRRPQTGEDVMIR
jgi:hypothetical protein